MTLQAIIWLPCEGFSSCCITKNAVRTLISVMNVVLDFQGERSFDKNHGNDKNSRVIHRKMVRLSACGQHFWLDHCLQSFAPKLQVDFASSNLRCEESKGAHALPTPPPPEKQKQTPPDFLGQNYAVGFGKHLTSNLTSSRKPFVSVNHAQMGESRVCDYDFSANDINNDKDDNYIYTTCHLGRSSRESSAAQK